MIVNTHSVNGMTVNGTIARHIVTESGTIWQIESDMRMYLIIDLEATCWSKDTPEGRIKSNRNENEIIEIGAAIVSHDFQILHSIGFFVKPTINPILSDFCKTLTSIQQSDVDNAETLNIVWPKFEDEILKLGGYPVREMMFCSWGYYDCRQLVRDCKRQKIQFPFTFHINIKEEFAQLKQIKPCGTMQALKLCGLQFDGVHHRGIDDAKNIARIFVNTWHDIDFKTGSRLIDY